MSSGSNPAQTSGLWCSAAMKWYGRQPMTVETWPGPMKPSRRRSGESRMALMAGMIVTWLQNTEKFPMPSAAARSMVMAVDGVVDPSHRDHADRAAGAVHQRDRLRQVVLQAVLVDRVGVPAAHLHQLVLAARLAQRRGLRGP